MSKLILERKAVVLVTFRTTKRSVNKVKLYFETKDYYHGMPYEDLKVLFKGIILERPRITKVLDLDLELTSAFVDEQGNVYTSNRTMQSDN